MRFSFIYRLLDFNHTLEDAFKYDYFLDVSFADNKHTIIIGGKSYPCSMSYSTIWLNVDVECSFNDVYDKH